MKNLTFYQLLVRLIENQHLTQIEVMRVAKVKRRGLITDWSKLKKAPRNKLYVLQVLLALGRLPKESAELLLSKAKAPTLEEWRKKLQHDDDKKGLYDLLQRLYPPQKSPFQVERFDKVLFGRKDVVDQVVDVLGRYKISVLYGMGGVGKTAIAQYIGHYLYEVYLSGVLWLDMGDLVGFADRQEQALKKKIRSIIRAYGAELELDADDSFADYARRFRDLFHQKKALLIFDNVAEEANERLLSSLLPTQHSLSAVLMTTRKKDLFKSKVHSPDYKINLLTLSVPDSYEFLLRGIGLEALQRTPQDTDTLLNMLDGHPLALELAIPNLQDLTVREYVGDLENEQTRLRLLADDDNEADDILSATFAVSLDKLKIVHRKVFIHLCVFASNHFHPKAVSDIARMELPDVKKSLRILDNRSLITLVDSRYRIHDLLRVFARSRTEMINMSFATLMRRFAEYYIDFSHELAMVYQFSELELEWGNIEATVNWLFEDTTAGDATQIVMNLSQYHFGAAGFLDVAAKFEEGQMWILALLEQNQAISQTDRADLLIRLAIFKYRQFKLQEAKTYLEQAQEILAKLPPDEQHTLLSSHLLGYLASIYIDWSEGESADQCLAEGEALLMQHDSVAYAQQTAFLQLVRGVLSGRLLDQFQDAIDVMEPALEVFPDEVTPSHLKAYNNLLICYFYLKNQEKVDFYFEKIVEVSYMLGDVRHDALAHKNMGIVYGANGRHKDSLKFKELAVAKFEQIASLRYLPDAYQNLTRAYLVDGQYDKALDCTIKAIDGARRSDNTSSLAYALTTQAELYILRTQYDKALVNLHEAEKVCLKNKHRKLLPIVLLNQAVVALEIAESARAQELCDQTQRVIGSQNPLALGVHGSVRAQIFDSLGQYELAYEAHLKALALLENCDAYELEKATRAYLRHLDLKK